MAHTYWKVSCVLPESAALSVETAFEGLALSAAAFETDEKNNLWTIDLLCQDNPDMEEIERRMQILAVTSGAPKPTITIERFEQQDWLSQVAKTFPAFSIGRFYVHGSHITDKPPVGSIPIHVDAGGAFGSGEHGTTSCCLEALESLSKRHGFSKVLDMGCGSGILAIAAAKLWRTNILAADIDPVAVQVTKENATINRVQTQIEAIVSDGYANKRIKEGAPYELIISNILARPLVAFAPMLAAHLDKGGFAVLSGLLSSQEAQVRSAHQAQGLKFRERFVNGDWHTLVFQK